MAAENGEAGFGSGAPPIEEAVINNYYAHPSHASLMPSNT
jgi:hypothetical protein